MSPTLLVLLTTLAVARTIAMDDGSSWAITAVGEATLVGAWRPVAGTRTNERGIRVVRATRLGVENRYYMESDCGGGDRVVRNRQLRNTSSDGHGADRAREILGTYAA